MHKKIASFLSQAASDIFTFCECANLCVRFKRTSPAALASLALCVRTQQQFFSLKALLLTRKTCSWTVQNYDRNLLKVAILRFNIDFFREGGSAPCADLSPSSTSFGASVLVARILSFVVLGPGQFCRRNVSAQTPDNLSPTTSAATIRCNHHATLNYPIVIILAPSEL